MGRCYSRGVRKAVAVAIFVLSTALSASTSQLEGEVAFRFAVARSLAEEGSIPEALEAWRELAGMVPDEPYVRMEYARFLSRIGRRDEAMEQASKGRDLAPENADVLRAFADVHLTAVRTHPESLDLARGALQDLVVLRPGDPRALTDLGRILYEQGRWSEAADWLGEAASLQPSNRLLVSFRVDALLKALRREEAEAVLRKAVALDPLFLNGRLQLATLESERAEHAAAVATLMGASEQQFEDRELRWQLSGELYRVGRIEEGLELVEGLVADTPDSERERILRGLMLGALGRDDEAVAVYEDLWRDQMGNLVVVGELVKIFERNGREREAEDLLRATEEALRPEGRWAEARFHLLNHLWRTESWGELIAASEEFVDDTGSPLHRQGVLFHVDGLHGNGESSQALEVLASLQVVPVHRVLAKEAVILAELGRGEEADAKLAVLAERGDLASLLAGAEVYHRLERYSEAVAILEQARRVDGDSNQVLYWLGAAHERSGDSKCAAEAFQALLRIDPGYAPALNYLGYMWAEEGENLEEALALVNRAVAQEPDNGAYVDSLAWAYFQSGEYGRARALLERASRLVPNDAVITEHLGDVYSRLGDWGRAGDLYRRALELGSEDEDGLRRKLEQLPDSR